MEGRFLCCRTPFRFIITHFVIELCVGNESEEFGIFSNFKGLKIN